MVIHAIHSFARLLNGNFTKLVPHIYPSDYSLDFFFFEFDVVIDIEL